MLNVNYGDASTARLLQLVASIVYVQGLQFVLISLLVNIDLRSQSQFLLFAD